MAATVYVWTYHIRLAYSVIAATSTGVNIVCFDLSRGVLGVQSPNRITEQAADELEEYIAGKRRKFTVPLSPRGTETQLLVWNMICNIPFGETMTCAEVSEKLAERGETISPKEVEEAAKKNPIMILIPEHRVVNEKGMPLGFGKNLHRRQGLQKFELEERGKIPPAYMKKWRLNI